MAQGGPTDIEQLRSEGYEFYLDAIDVTAFPSELRTQLARLIIPRLIRSLQEEGFELLLRRPPLTFLLVHKNGQRIPIGFADEVLAPTQNLSRNAHLVVMQLMHLLAFTSWARVWIEPKLAEIERNKR